MKANQEFSIIIYFGRFFIKETCAKLYIPKPKNQRAYTILVKCNFIFVLYSNTVIDISFTMQEPQKD